jgi:ATP-binding cassette subfamily F protein 3
MLNPSRTVLDEALSTGARVTEQYVRTLLGCFLFRDDDVFKRVSVLSGGEKSRLALVKILLEPPNLLLMDEPTTHLDMSSIDALVAALTEYTGTLVFISHDVHFIRSLAERVVHVNAGRLTWFAGDYEYYLQKSKLDSARAGLVAGNLTNSQPTQLSEAQADRTADPAVPNQKERKRIAAEARQVRSAQKKKVAELEKRIAEFETLQVELTAELEKPETYTKPGRAVEVNTKLKHAIDQTAELTNAWETEAAKLLEMEEES